MKKIVVLIDPVSAGLHLIDAALVENEFIAVYTIGKERAEKYVPSILEIEQKALQVIFSDDPDLAYMEMKPEYRERAISVLPASEPGVEMASALAAKMGLIHLNEKATTICRDKTSIRAALHHLSIPSVKFEKCSSFEACLEFVDKNQLPVVMKHPTGAGQNNIFICQNKKEIEIAFHTIVSSPNLFGQMSDVVLIEQYLDGKEYAVNYIVSNSKIRKLDTWQYEHYLFDDKNRLYDNISHFQKPREGQERVEKYAVDVIKTLGIDFGFIHLEVIDDKTKGPVLVDIGARLIGGHFTALIKQLGLGDPFQTTLKLYDGTLDIDAMTYAPKKSMSGVFLPIHKTGVLKSIKGLEEIKSRSSYGFHFCSVKEGDKIQRSFELGNMAASIYISADTDEQLWEEINFIRENFKLETA